MPAGRRQWLYVQLAERFPGHWPWDLEDVPVDRLLAYLDLLGVESYVRTEREGLGPDDTVDCFGCYAE